MRFLIRGLMQGCCVLMLGFSLPVLSERELERLADCYEKNLNIDALCAAIS